MDGTVRKVTFRVQHDCPIAQLSRAVAGPLQVWSGHRLEMVAVPHGRRRPDETMAILRQHLHPEHVLPMADGWLALWRPDVEPERSISRTLEGHGLLWLQPLRVVDGWEHYDALAFGGGEQAALDALRADHATQVVRREDIGSDDVAASLFLSLAPTLDAPTDKQAEALVTAFEHGYYRSPRGATTGDVAAALGITRSSFEERLRAGENRVMAEVAPAMRWHRATQG